LATFVDGRDAPRAHGTPEMPVWGERLYEGERAESPAREAARRGTILLILEYLQTLQQPAPAPADARAVAPPALPADRSGALDVLERERFDCVVIGGGITGAGIAREAARRGLAVALLEAADFAAGTSSRSSKLIHGGLRYLAMGDV